MAIGLVAFFRAVLIDVCVLCLIHTPGAGDPGAAGQDVQGAAVLELVPPQHRPRDDPAGHRQHLPGPVHRAGGQRLRRLLRRVRRRVGGRRRRLRDEAVLRRRRLTYGRRRAVATAMRTVSSFIPRTTAGH